MKMSSYFQIFPGKNGEPAVALHSRTGASFAFSEEMYGRLQTFIKNPNNDGDPELEDFLIYQDVLIPDKINELELIKEKYRRDRKSKEELYVTYSMTNACNFRCTYCYQEHKAEVLEKENLEKTFLYIERELPGYERLKVHWFGGEPTLRLPWIEQSAKRLVDLCNELGKGYFSGITTNGSRFDENTASLLKRCHVNQVQFTLDGDQELHDLFRISKSGRGTFLIVLNAIKTSVKAGFITFVRVNISPRNYSRLGKLLDRLQSEEIGPHNIVLYLNEMKQHSNSANNPSMYFSSIEKYGDALVESLKILKSYGYPVPRILPVDVNCQFDKPSSVLFGVDGNLYHCTTGTDKALAELDNRGSVTKETARRKFVHEREPWDDPTCAKCPNLPTCMGGCAYLDEEGKVKCNPEGFVIEDILRLAL